MARDYPMNLLIAAAGAMTWMAIQPVAAQEAGAGFFRLACPAVLPPGTVAMRTTPDNWTVSATRPSRLDGSGMLHGAPDEEGFLVPNAGDGKKGRAGSTAVRRWSFEVPHGYEKWAYCGYGPVQLARRVPVHTSECVATEVWEHGRYAPTVFICK